MQEPTRVRTPKRAPRWRLALLLVVLFVVALYAAHDVYERRSRNQWDRTLRVAIVVLELDPVAESALSALGARLPALEARLFAELRRYRSDAPMPFRFELFGPIRVNVPPPEPKNEGIVELFSHSFKLWRYIRAIDDEAAARSPSYDPAAFDSRVYVTVRLPSTPNTRLIEGMSQQNGRIGTVSVELANDMVDLALFVAAHELFHTLGASDKYDANGKILVPSGLAEPAKMPLYPQRYAEIMARHRPVSPAEDVIPDSLDELAVGRDTALEIGWLEQ